jgi:DNA-binding transcriptional MocR family regulator
MKTLPTTKTVGNWVQTERESHEAWAALTRKSPLAAQIMHLLAARVGEHNAVIISQGALAELAGASRRGVQNALSLLNRERWLEIRQIGERSTVNAYVVNDRVIWGTARNGLRYSLFSATVIASSKEQPDESELDHNRDLRPLRRLPRVGEGQLPDGPGLPPPSEPFLDGMEPDLPATQQTDPEQMDVESYIADQDSELVQSAREALDIAEGKTPPAAKFPSDD